MLRPPPKSPPFPYPTHFRSVGTGQIAGDDNKSVAAALAQPHAVEVGCAIAPLGSAANTLELQSRPQVVLRQLVGRAVGLQQDDRDHIVGRRSEAEFVDVSRA